MQNECSNGAGVRASRNARMDALLEAWPDLDEVVNVIRSRRGANAAAWPAWCFVPVSEWQRRGEIQAVAKRAAVELPVVAALAAWLYSRGTYRINTEHALACHAAAASAHALPSEVLYRLPQWCVYVVAPAADLLFDGIAGFWCYLDFLPDTAGARLSLVADAPGGLVCGHLALGPWTIDKAIADAQAPQIRPDLLAGILDLVLALCAAGVDISTAGGGCRRPARPRPHRQRSSWKMRPAASETPWTIRLPFSGAGVWCCATPPPSGARAGAVGQLRWNAQSADPAPAG